MEELKAVLTKILKHNYANFNGRADRSEFWLFAFAQYVYMTLCVLILYFAFLFALIFSYIKSQDTIIAPTTSLIMIFGVYAGIFLAFLPILIPMLAVAVRRLHDTNRSGWWILLSFVPLVGFIVAFFLTQQGTKGTNQYGEDPRIEVYKKYLDEVEQTMGNKI